MSLATDKGPHNPASPPWVPLRLKQEATVKEDRDKEGLVAATGKHPWEEVVPWIAIVFWELLESKP